MNVWYSLSDIPGNEASVVTIGNFDGMHNGHKKVISTCIERAHKLGVDAVAITFDPHPIQVHKPEVGLQLISPLRDRLDAMAAAGLRIPGRALRRARGRCRRRLPFRTRQRGHH